MSSEAAIRTLSPAAPEAEPLRTPLGDLIDGCRRLRALPVLGAFSIGAGLGVVVTPGRPAVGVAALAGAAVAGCAAMTARSRRALLAVVVLAVLLGVARAEVGGADAGIAARAAALAGAPVQLTGTVASEPEPTSAGMQLLVDPSEIVATAGARVGARLPPAGLVLVEVKEGDAPLEGDVVQVSGSLEVPHDTAGFDWRAYLAAEGAYLQLTAGGVTVEEAAAGVQGWRTLPARIREAYQGAIQRELGQPRAALLVAVVLGVRSGVPARVDQALIDTGLIHLLVLSGLKVAIFSRLVVSLLRPLLRRAAIWPALALIGLYGLVGGATPAAVRACGMGALALIAVQLGRQTHVWTSLVALAAAMLAWSPALVLDVGFQLSFAGTAAIVLLAPALERRLDRLPAVVREPLAVTAAAQIGTAPLVAASFGVLSLAAPLANALLLPLLPAAIAGGLVVAPLAIVPALGRLAALPLAALVEFLEQVAGLLARVPGAALPTPNVGAWIGGAYYLAVGAGLVAVESSGRARRMAIAIGILGPLLITGGEVAVWSHPTPAVTALAVGAGQAVLLRGPSGLVLVDGGPQPATLASALGEQLAPWERRLAALVITDGAAADVAGLDHLAFGVGAVMAPAGGLTGSAWEPPVAAAAGDGVPLETLGAGAETTLAGLTLQALSPAPGQPPGGQLAFRVVGPDATFCDLADLAAADQALAAGWLRGGCDTLLVAGQGTAAPSAAFLARARPRTLLVSDATGSRLARGFPAGVERTGEEGDLTAPL